MASLFASWQGFGLNDFLDIEDIGRKEKSVSLCKSDEEIKQLTLDPSLTGIDRILFLINAKKKLKNALTIQNITFLILSDIGCYSSLPVDSKTNQYYSEVKAILEAKGPNQQQYHQEATNVLNEYFSKGGVNLEKTERIKTDILPIILQYSIYPKQELASLWTNTLKTCIPNIKPETIASLIAPRLTAMCHFDQPLADRLAGTSALGVAISQMLAPAREPFYSLIVKLCHDSEWMIRACVCEQFGAVFSSTAPSSLTRVTLLAELNTLLSDEHSNVVEKALNALYDAYSSFSSSASPSSFDQFKPCASSVWQAYRRNGDSLLACPSYLLPFLGKAFVVTKCLNDQECQQGLLSLYAKLCSSSVVDHRSTAAFNFPGIVITVGYDHFFEASGLFTSLTRLARDDTVSIRKTVASFFHEILRQAPHSVALRGEVCRLFASLVADQSSDVAEALVEGLPVTINAFKMAAAPIPDSPTFSNDIVFAVGDLLLKVKDNYRTLSRAISNLRPLIKLFSGEQIYRFILPQLSFLLFCTLPPATTSSVIDTWVLSVRNLDRYDRMVKLCTWANEELLEGLSCYLREVYIDLAARILEHFSRNFFKELIFTPLLTLAQDPVPSVRIKLCAMFCRLKKTIKLPFDRNLLHVLDCAVMRVADGCLNNSDLVTLAAKTKTAFDKIVVPVGWDPSRQLFEDDLIDQSKQEYEESLIDKEKKPPPEKKLTNNANTSNAAQKPRIKSAGTTNNITSIAVPKKALVVESPLLPRRSSLRKTSNASIASIDLPHGPQHPSTPQGNLTSNGSVTSLPLIDTKSSGSQSRLNDLKNAPPSLSKLGKDADLKKKSSNASVLSTESIEINKMEKRLSEMIHPPSPNRNISLLSKDTQHKGSTSSISSINSTGSNSSKTNFVFSPPKTVDGSDDEEQIQIIQSHLESNKASGSLFKRITRRQSASTEDLFRGTVSDSDDDEFQPGILRKESFHSSLTDLVGKPVSAHHHVSLSPISHSKPKGSRSDLSSANSSTKPSIKTTGSKPSVTSTNEPLFPRIKNIPKSTPRLTPSSTKLK